MGLGYLKLRSTRVYFGHPGSFWRVRIISPPHSSPAGHRCLPDCAASLFLRPSSSPRYQRCVSILRSSGPPGARYCLWQFMASRISHPHRLSVLRRHQPTTTQLANLDSPHREVSSIREDEALLCGVHDSQVWVGECVQDKLSTLPSDVRRYNQAQLRSVANLMWKKLKKFRFFFIFQQRHRTEIENKINVEEMHKLTDVVNYDSTHLQK